MLVHSLKLLPGVLSRAACKGKLSTCWIVVD